MTENHPPTPNGNGFNKYQYYILEELKRHDDWLRHLDKKSEKIELTVETLKVKTLMIVAAISIIISSIVTIASAILTRVL